MQPITLQPIETPVELKCPHCNQPIYLVLKNSSEVIRGGCWLRDGNSIPRLYKALSKQQKTPNGFDYELLVGSQSCCRQDYFVVECTFIDTCFETENEVTYFFQRHLDADESRNFVAFCRSNNKSIPPQWIVTQAPSPKGIIHSHLFGPFFPVDYISSPYKVMADDLVGVDTWTYGRELLLTLWDDLKELVKLANQNSKLMTLF